MSEMNEGLMAQLRQADWDGLERDVVMRIRVLRGITEKLTGDLRATDLIARDLIEPNVALLARFCINVEIEDEKGVGG